MYIQPVVKPNQQLNAQLSPFVSLIYSPRWGYNRVWENWDLFFLLQARSSAKVLLFSPCQGYTYHNFEFRFQWLLFLWNFNIRKLDVTSVNRSQVSKVRYSCSLFVFSSHLFPLHTNIPSYSSFNQWIFLRIIQPTWISICVHLAAFKMGLPPDSASLIMLEIGKELRFYEDTLALIGLLYAGKLATSFSLSLYRGFKEHIFTKLYPNKETVMSFGSWAGKTFICEAHFYCCSS